MRYKVPIALVRATFDVFRQCGAGNHECQVLWTSAWTDPSSICRVVHPRHRAHCGGFELEDDWINTFWLDLARRDEGVRFQVHTHPREAFHSSVDDAYPILHFAGFLSLVIPDFGAGPVGFARAYLAEIAPNGQWVEVAPDSRIDVIA
jgi:hypothetical protein